MIDYVKYCYTIPYIPVEQRYDILPEHSICSISPADTSADDFITGNGAGTRKSTPCWTKRRRPPDLKST